ncbi:MAG: serine/threonine protein kinase, partial [Deltaproteobacteria bacterium]|nr:serine/threonine protein kinase [Deltaproteobacteria bacterium]MBW2537098.1 serine/threonine protein kinase [Deltaproteobacteria bacterium]
MAQSSDSAAPTLVFERLAEIAVGATAQIQLCRVTEGPRAGQFVVVKRLHPHVAEDPQFVDMFRDEAWMTAALENPHVVQVISWGVDEQGAYLAAEFVRGVSLARLMKTVFETGEQFTERQVVYLGFCICDGLAAAHSLRSPNGQLLNLVHRDMTPGNVLLGFDGQVKIADFGLAKARMRLTKTLTGLLKGQPHYMAPEQIKSLPIDGRTDIFAFGVVLYELFAGRRPWNAQSDLEAMRATLEQNPAPLDEHRPSIDKALVKLVDKCLQKDPAARFQTADVLRDEFSKWLQAHGYREDNDIALARFVRRNAMRQMRWFDRAMAGHFAKGPATDLEQSDTVAASPQGRGRPGAAISVPPSAPIGGSEPPPGNGVDWAEEEGPTLIQPDQKGKGVLRKLTAGLRRGSRPRGSGRRRLPTAPTRPAVALDGL